tara:strand:+ start:196 stop:2004 length:1809 start_codon:yes stop_codon:yes gene_type:complete
MTESLFSYFQKHFRLISCDSEFQTVAGEMPNVLCFVYKDIITGEVWRCETSEEVKALPFDYNSTCFIVYNAVAECKAWLAWGIDVPEYILDLWIEAKNISQSGSGKTKGFNTQLNVARRFGMPEKYVMLEKEKDTMRDLILDNKSWSSKKWISILDYCEKDTVLCGMLLQPLCAAIEEKFRDRKIPHIAQQMLCRGLAKGYEAVIFQNGIPIDLKNYNKFQKDWKKVSRKFQIEKNKILNVYDDEGIFKQDKFEQLLKDIYLYDEWPKTQTYKCSTARKTLEDFEERHPKIKLLRAVKKILESDRLQGYAVGKDGRSRGDHNFYSTITGRATPSSTDTPFVSSRWLRSFIKAPEGKVLVYADFKHEEPCIQAALSKDKNLIEAVKEDVYMFTANAAGATKGVNDPDRLKIIRKQYKEAFLAIGYGMGYRALAGKINRPEIEAQEIIAEIKSLYRDYYAWIFRTVQMFKIKGQMTTFHGWCRSCKNVRNLNTRKDHRSLENWPIQSHGAEILYWTVINLIRDDFKICATVHDAVLVELDDDQQLEANLTRLKNKMAVCAEDIIGQKIGSDGCEMKNVIRGYWQQEDDAKALYDEVMKFLNEVE